MANLIVSIPSRSSQTHHSSTLDLIKKLPVKESKNRGLSLDNFINITTSSSLFTTGTPGDNEITSTINLTDKNNDINYPYLKTNIKIHSIPTNNTGTLLHHAVKEGDEKKIKELIITNTNINDADSHGMTPIHLASLVGNINILKALIDAGADVNAANNNGKTSLHLVFEQTDEDNNNSKRLNCAQALLGAKIEVNAADNNNETALLLAVKKEDEIILHQLIKNGANVNDSDKQNRTPLAWATSKNNPKLINLLINARADINSTFSLSTDEEDNIETASKIFTLYNQLEPDNKIIMLESLIKADSKNLIRKLIISTHNLDWNNLLKTAYKNQEMYKLIDIQKILRKKFNFDLSSLINEYLVK